MLNLVLSALVSFSAQATDLSKVVEKVEEVNKIRETNVKGVQGNVNKEVFKAVCGPVGKRAQQIAKDNKWKFLQLSHKNRNPKNAAKGLAKEAITKFQKDLALQSFWLKEKGKNHYFRRITVQSSCLACHGEKNLRPDFIKKAFPEDKAFGFNVGELRGLYHVSF